MDAYERLRSLGMFRMRPGLGRIRRILKELGGPQTKKPSILIGGTNGKGSTCYMCGSILQEAGLECCIYTSPHLERLTERLLVRGKEVDPGLLERGLERVFEVIDRAGDLDRSTYFEVLTAASFLISAEEGTDVLISEVGLGGKYDATNVLEPIAVGITSVSLDHQNVLGDDVVEIALQKAGIIKPVTPVVVGPVWRGDREELRALKAVLDSCMENGCPVVLVDPEPTEKKLDYLISGMDLPDWRLVSPREVDVEKGQCFKFDVSSPEDPPSPYRPFSVLDMSAGRSFNIGLNGVHQIYNSAVALSLCLISYPSLNDHLRTIKGDRGAFSRLMSDPAGSQVAERDWGHLFGAAHGGLMKVTMRARLEEFEVDGRRILLDSSHNIEAADSLNDHLMRTYPDEKVDLLFTMMRDKDPAGYLSRVGGRLRSITLTDMGSERGFSPSEMLPLIVPALRSGPDIHIRPHLEDATLHWFHLIGKGGIGVSSGTSYTYGRVKELLTMSE